MAGQEFPLLLCIFRDDLARAIKKLKSLGGGFAVIPVGKRRLVQCVPGELSMDHTTVLQKAEVLTCVCIHVYLYILDVYLCTVPTYKR